MSEWISCKDRLPEGDGVNSYILTIVDEDGTTTTMGWYSKDRKQWYDEEGWPIQGNTLVTAWQPLPEPYEGD